MDVIRTISLGEKVDLLARLLFYVPLIFTRETIKTTVIAVQRGLPVKEYMAATVVRTLMTCLTERQMLYLNGPTSQTYQTWVEKEAKTRNLSPVKDTVILADGTTKLHWIRRTEEKASKVVLLFHGGGYYIPIAPGHLNWCSSIINASGSTKKNIAAAVLEYDLTTQAKYPRQLQQATFALHHLLKLGYQPGDIFIGGDSAGGHLSLSLLSHLMHRHPSVPSVDISGPLAGAFLISPWVNDDCSTASFKENAWIDMLPHEIIPGVATFFIPSDIRQAESDNKQGWSMAQDANGDWWRPLADIVSNVYITAGEQELFRDHVVILADMLREQAPKCKIRFELGVGEGHDHMLLWEMLRYRENPALRRLDEWFVTILQE
ncbi:alpha/beta-hydrolase, partial [Aureobasidium melanogenum]